MRVMHIITRMIIGGAQENTLYNCLDLIRDFHDDVRLVTGPSEGAEGKLLAIANTDGLPVELHPALLRSIRPFKDLQAYQKLKQSIQKWKPDVVHTHSAKAGLLGRAAAWNCNVPCVIHTVHGAPFHPFQNRFSHRFFVECERWAAKRCHHMVCVADAMTELMVQARIAERSKFTTVYSGMDVEPFLNCNTNRDSVRQRLGFKPTDVVFGKIARLFHLKGHSYVIEAAKQVCRADTNARFLFVGNGILKSQLDSEIANANLTDRFVFTGLVPPEQVPDYVGAMDVLVHTSLREGLARALPQALIAGKPAISYDVDGAKEVVLNGKTGYLLPAKSTNELSVAMLKLATDANLRAEMGRLGQSLFTEQFRHQSMTRTIRQIYLSHLPSADFSKRIS